MTRLRLIQWYYLLSPIFFVFGWWWNAEVRVTFLPDLRHRFAYYVVLSGLGLLVHFRPRTAPWVCLTESTGNLFLLILWILLPIYGAADALPDLQAGGEFRLPYSAGQVLLNGLLAGSFFLLGFYQSQAEIMSRLRGGGWTQRRDPRRR